MFVFWKRKDPKTSARGLLVASSSPIVVFIADRPLLHRDSTAAAPSDSISADFTPISPDFFTTNTEMELHDKNHDGLVSFAEYQPPTWVRDSVSTDYNVRRFLSVGNFCNCFQHPPDTQNPRLLKWLCKEEVRERDSDKDGKVNFKEFFHGLFDLVRNYDEDGHNSSHESGDSLESPARTFFAQLDKDGDGFLSDVEMLSIIGKLHPSERYYAKQQADYIISQADTDKDGRLSLTEMIESPYVFYSAIFNEDEDEDYE
ncbi:hypothetical protein LXL04_025736 [Taraxacum kok-saghyz]